MKYSVGILTGGKSSRMGRNKAFLEINGKSFIENAINTGLNFDQTILSVDSKDKYSEIINKYQNEITVVEDVRKEYGPLEGIYRMLLAADFKYIFIMAVDMPFMNMEFIEKMFSYVDDETDCIVLKNNGRTEQLCTIYSKKLVPVIENMFENDEHKLKLLFERTNVKYIDIVEFGELSLALRNVNTPEEYNKI